MYPPVNDRLDHKSSSSSDSPQSETTLDDEVMVSEALPPPPRGPRHIDHAIQRNNFEENQQARQQIYNSVSAINTDYESSTAEDIDSHQPLSNKYKDAESAFLSYSRTNKLEKLQALLEAKLRNEISLDLNFKGQQKQNFSWSALHLACYFGHKKVVEQLLSRQQFREEVDINIQNSSGDTPLHKAALTDRVILVQLLLSHGANVFIKNCDDLLPKQLTKNKHIFDMLEAAEEVDKIKIRKDMFKAVDNGDLRKVQEYFENYSSQTDLSHRAEVNVGRETDDTNEGPTSSRPANNIIKSGGMLCQLIDERGNTLLHLAAMRGFKAICVYLLEQGLDPYKKNNLGQTCLDLSSYQLRQLFITVKPANNQLKKLSKSRVTRFEGPLLKKVRILGWKQIYAVLENGVILLFNDRKDSMNKSRRGYKYLESATCEPDPSCDIGTFTVRFSDKSMATFMVTTEHLNSYTCFKSITEKSNSSRNQIELIRQKWIDSIRDHIKYSTDFIRSGLKINDHDAEDDIYQEGDITTLNHLLPINTIKSFIQEARAHYSILERHAESLCSLVHSISSSSDRLSNSFESSNHEEEANRTSADLQPVVSSTTTSASSRLFGLIRNSKQVKGNLTSADDGASGQNSNQQILNSSNRRRRNNSLTNEFIQDNWHCLLFHLHLLVESTQNTRSSMGQALALMEHQEQLRQNRIQDQDERCRVLEDSLHALARDHHELEKSISTSQIYNTASGRSMSSSTDLNEYFDAFEDFDDEKTMTPDSMPSDEDLNQQIQEVMNEGNGEPGMKVYRNVAHLSSSNHMDLLDRERNRPIDSTDEDDDDSHSNCSALTVETISDQPLIVRSGECKLINSTTIATIDSTTSELKRIRHRTRLPSPMVPRDQVSIWSILKNCIGKELSKITMPVVFNEPLTMLQRACEGVQYSRYLQMADQSDDPIERMEYVCTFIVAGLSANCHRIIKPFNPLLYETYELDHELEDGSHVRAMSQQVSHHPPITAAYSESDYFITNGSVNPKIKFWGRSIEVQPDGQCRVYLKRHKETYMFKSVSCSIHNIIVGKLWFEHRGPLDIKCVETNVRANLIFKQAGWFSNDLHRFDGVIVSGDDKKKERFVYGKWSDYIKSVEYFYYENYMKENQNKLFRIPDNPDQGQSASNGLVSKLEKFSLTRSANNSINNNDNSRSNTGQIAGEDMSSNLVSKENKSTSKSGDNKRAGNFAKSESSQSLDIPNSRTLWKLESQYMEEYYNFTSFTMRLNELTPELELVLPRTDSRFRPDVRKLEAGDLDGAANEKQRLEEKQREARARDKRFKDPSPDFLWFDLKNVPSSQEKFWIYKGQYWESKCNLEKFPDLF